MKCLRKICQYQAKPERAYCSTDCAQIDRDRDREGGDSPSMSAGESSIKDAGDASDLSCDDENEIDPPISSERKTRHSKRKNEQDSSDIIKQPEETDTWLENEPSTGLSPKSSDAPLASEEDRGADGLIRLTASLSPSGTSLLETSHSMSLIDESASHLRDLMKSAAPSKTSDPEKIKSACEAAKQMTSLLRLKLDILKELRR